MPVIMLPTTGRDNKKLEKALRKLFPNGDFKYRKVHNHYLKQKRVVD